MKRWIHASDEIDSSTLYQAQQFAKRFKGSRIDLENHEIIIPFGKGATEDGIMGQMGLGTWFKDNGFDVSLEQKDIDYTTQGDWLNYRGWTKSKGHSAMLRDRLVLTAKW